MIARQRGSGRSCCPPLRAAWPYWCKLLVPQPARVHHAQDGYDFFVVAIQDDMMPYGVLADTIVAFTPHFGERPDALEYGVENPLVLVNLLVTPGFQGVLLDI